MNKLALFCTLFITSVIGAGPSHAQDTDELTGFSQEILIGPSIQNATNPYYLPGIDLRVGKYWSDYFESGALVSGAYIISPSGTVDQPANAPGLQAVAAIDTRWYPLGKNLALQPYISLALGTSLLSTPYELTLPGSEETTKDVSNTFSIYTGASIGTHYQFNPRWAATGQVTIDSAYLIRASLGGRYLF